MRRRKQRGFTLIELMMVVAILTVATVVAWPTLSTFLGRDSEASAATDVARLINRARDQAQRRNRAYLLRFDNFNEGQPTGSVGVIEGRGPSCRTLTGDPATGRLLQTVPFGETPQGNFSGEVEKKVGFRGWRAPGSDDDRFDALDLCIGPNGSVQWLPAGGVPQPVGGRLRILVQRFEIRDANWGFAGPARRVEVTFAGGAQMGVN